MTLYINGVEIEDTFAEGFKMWGARVIITGKNRKWALEAATKMIGLCHLGNRLQMRGRDRR